MRCVGRRPSGTPSLATAGKKKKKKFLKHKFKMSGLGGRHSGTAAPVRASTQQCPASQVQKIIVILLTPVHSSSADIWEARATSCVGVSVLD